MGMTVEQLMEKIDGQIDAKLQPLIDKVGEVDNKLTKIPQEKKEESEKLPWSEVCNRVALIAKAQIYRDPKALDALAKSDWLNETTGSEGGYTVPVEFSTEVFRLVEEYGVARRGCFPVPMKSATKKMPSGLTGVDMSYIGEGEAKPLTKPSFGIVELVARTAAGISAMTRDIIDDSAVDMVAYLTRLITESLAKREDTSCFFGNGATILGIANTVGVIPVIASGATLAGVTANDLNKLFYAISDAAARGASFYCNRGLVGVLQQLQDKQGQYIVQKPTEGAPASLWGFPIITSDAFSATPSAGDVVAVFGNLRNCYFGQRKELDILPSDEATLGVYTDGKLTDIVSAYQKNMRFIRFEVRHDFKPALASAFAVLKLATS
jgi:HK97 family phage major capsid protein